VDQREAGPLPGRLEEHDFALLKFGGIGTCHLTLIILVAVLQLCGWR